jgi:ferredoxin, 2Fe-2S
MANITFIEADESKHMVDSLPGETLMQAAVRAGVPGILAMCGGGCACATCHVHIDPRWADACNAPTGLEKDLLEMLSDADADSRLACQVTISENLDGVLVRIPKSQEFA